MQGREVAHGWHLGAPRRHDGLAPRVLIVAATTARTTEALYEALHEGRCFSFLFVAHILQTGHGLVDAGSVYGGRMAGNGKAGPQNISSPNQ